MHSASFCPAQAGRWRGKHVAVTWPLCFSAAILGIGRHCFNLPCRLERSRIFWKDGSNIHATRIQILQRGDSTMITHDARDSQRPLWSLWSHTIETYRDFGGEIGAAPVLDKCPTQVNTINIDAVFWLVRLVDLRHWRHLDMSSQAECGCGNHTGS